MSVTAISGSAVCERLRGKGTGAGIFAGKTVLFIPESLEYTTIKALYESPDHYLDQNFTSKRFRSFTAGFAFTESMVWSKVNVDLYSA